VSAHTFYGAYSRMDHKCAKSALLGVSALGRRSRLDSRAMDRRLARRNIRTGLIVAVIGLLMFALTFVAALAYVG